MRKRSRPTPDIELISAYGEQPDRSASTAESSRVPLWAVPIGVALFAGGLSLLRILGDPVDRNSEPLPDGTDSGSEEGSPDSEPTPEPTPLVTRVAGPNIPIIEGTDGVSVLYVNTRSNPTLVDFDTGDHFELVLSADVAQVMFTVDRGRLVAKTSTEEQTTDRAFALLAYRTAGTGPEPREAMRESETMMVPICSDFGCSILGDGPSLGRNGDVLRLLSEQTDTDIASMLDPKIWRHAGEWILPPTGSEFEVRLPAPAAYSPIYFIHQS